MGCRHVPGTERNDLQVNGGSWRGERVAVGSGLTSSDGTPGNANSFEPSLSPDGRTAAFYSGASNLVEGDTNEVADIFLRKLGGAEPAGDIAGPTATFALNATELSAGQSVTLDQRKLTGGMGVDRVVCWGDGSAPQSLGATTATHVYPTVGNCRVGVVLIDQAGNRTGAGMQGSSTVSVKASTGNG